VNISIDSLDPGKYKQIARADSLNDALAGVDAAIDAGLTPVKINTVLMHGVNDNEIDDFIALTKDRDVQVRFIEYMPMGRQHEGRYISAREIVKARPQLQKYDETKGVEALYHIDGHKGKIGFITPVSRPFCEKCNRIRVTADAKIRHCLGNNLETDLREILKEDDQTAQELIQAAAFQKPIKGFCNGFETNRGMGNIGG
jgi:cyclic pyranopterin phosphate synthase